MTCLKRACRKLSTLLRWMWKQTLWDKLVHHSVLWRSRRVTKDQQQQKKITQRMLSNLFSYWLFHQSNLNVSYWYKHTNKKCHHRICWAEKWIYFLLFFNQKGDLTQQWEIHSQTSVQNSAATVKKRNASVARVCLTALQDGNPHFLPHPPSPSLLFSNDD